MNFVFKTRDFVSKTRNCVLKMMKFSADGVRVNCLSPGPFPNDGAPADMVHSCREMMIFLLKTTILC